MSTTSSNATSSPSVLCPNLTLLVGADVAGRLLQLCGGSVTALAKLKSNNLRHLGERRKVDASIELLLKEKATTTSAAAAVGIGAQNDDDEDEDDERRTGNASSSAAASSSTARPEKTATIINLMDDDAAEDDDGVDGDGGRPHTNAAPSPASGNEINQCGTIADAPILESVSSRNKFKACCLLANKAQLAARADAASSSTSSASGQPDTSTGRTLLAKIKEDFERLESAGAHVEDHVQALPVPKFGAFVKSRAGAKMQRLNAKFQTSLIEQKANVIKFGESADSQAESLMRSRDVRGEIVHQVAMAQRKQAEELRKMGAAKREREELKQHVRTVGHDHDDLLNLVLGD